MSIVEQIKKELNEYIDDEKAAFLPRFFQAFEGGYGEGDRFIGVSVPNQRKVARKYFKSIDIRDVERLLTSRFMSIGSPPFSCDQ